MKNRVNESKIKFLTELSDELSSYDAKFLDDLASDEIDEFITYQSDVANIIQSQIYFWIALLNNEE